MKTTFKHRKIARTLIAGMLLSALPLAPVHADMISTPQLVEQEQTLQQRAELEQLLARDGVASYLQSQGVSADDVKNRLQNLSDAEVREFHRQLNELPAGEGVLGAVLAIIVIFMLLDMAGVTDIFPRI